MHSLARPTRQSVPQWHAQPGQQAGARSPKGLRQFSPRCGSPTTLSRAATGAAARRRRVGVPTSGALANAARPYSASMAAQAGGSHCVKRVNAASSRPGCALDRATRRCRWKLRHTSAGCAGHAGFFGHGAMRVVTNSTAASAIGKRGSARLCSSWGR